MDREPSRAEIDALAGTTLLEFGAAWCPICRGARPLVDELLRDMTGVRYLRVEDGKGRRLGRSFRVKLWPTLIVVQDGRELARVVRPNGASDLQPLIAAVEPHTAAGQP
jgi:thioredoxin 1